MKKALLCLILVCLFVTTASAVIVPLYDPHAIHWDTYTGGVYTLDTASIILTDGLLTLGGENTDFSASARLKWWDDLDNVFSQGITYSDTPDRAAHTFYSRARGTYASKAAVQEDDRLGGVVAQGWDGDSFESVAAIVFEVDGAVSDEVVPSRISFETISTTFPRAVRMVIDSAGDIDFQAGNLVTIGILQAARVAIDDVSTYIDKDGSDNMTFTDGVTGTKTLAELAAGGGGGVDTSGTPVANDIARFTDADTIEGRSYNELLTDLSGQAGATFDWNNQNLTAIGTINLTENTALIQVDGATFLSNDGSANLFFGDGAFDKDSGSNNIGIGYHAGFYNDTTGGGNNGNGNIYVGYQTGQGIAGYGYNRGGLNLAMGYKSFAQNRTGNYNISLGSLSLEKNQTGSYNVGVGFGALNDNVAGSFNIVLGRYGFRYNTGSYNTGLGYRVGYLKVAGDRNIFIGNDAAYRQTEVSNLLLIDNLLRADAATELTNAIVVGVMAASPADQTLRLNAAVEIVGDTFWTGDGTGLPYGHMYDNGTIAVSITNNNPTEIASGFTTGQTNLVTFGGAHYLAVDKAGRYMVTWSMSIAQNSPAAAIQCEQGIMIGGAASLLGRSHRTIANSTDIGASAGTAIIDLAANDQVSLYIANLSSTTDIDVEHANLTITMLGGT